MKQEDPVSFLHGFGRKRRLYTFGRKPSQGNAAILAQFPQLFANNIKFPGHLPPLAAEVDSTLETLMISSASGVAQ